jgi:hypothetical protein
LRAFRGIDTLTAFSIHLELGADWKRFEKPSSLSAWLGLTPSLSLNPPFCGGVAVLAADWALVRGLAGV